MDVCGTYINPKKCGMQNSWMPQTSWYKMCISPKIGCQAKTWPNDHGK
jgi:hypothetical protein